MLRFKKKKRLEGERTVLFSANHLFLCFLLVILFCQLLLFLFGNLVQLIFESKDREKIIINICYTQEINFAFPVMTCYLTVS